jgi:hypothetical protein
VIDTLTKLAGIKDENSSTEAQAATGPLQQAADKGLAPLVVQHARKSAGDVEDTARGSSAFGGDADIILEITRPRGSGLVPNQRVIHSVSRFDETPDDVVIELTDDGYVLVGDPGVSKLNNSIRTIRETLGAAFEANRIGLTTEELCERTQLTKSQVERALRGMEHEVYSTGAGVRVTPISGTHWLRAITRKAVRFKSNP